MKTLIKAPLIVLSISLTFLLTNISAHADVYSYITADGSAVLTDQRIRKKGYKLIKVYNVKKKKKTVFTKLSLHKKKQYRPSVKRKHKGNGIIHGCSNKQYLASKARAYQRTIQVYARAYKVEEELIHAIVKQESCFNETAHSRAGAIGLMQLMPGTADMMKISNPWNPEQNIQGGVKYISQMLRLFKGEKRLAVAAYNAGPGKVKRYKGIPPYRETKNYVKKVMAEYHRLKKQGLPKSRYALAKLSISTK
ncbi:MAG: lytic transglycosylase domain-containing protein [Cocleimonas sp.]|nr:lytic transglycosylase domain-containing protein [Cocleimonas sp.]